MPQYPTGPTNDASSGGSGGLSIPMTSGFWVPSSLSHTGGSTDSENEMVAIPFLNLYGTRSFQAIGVHVNSAGGDAAVERLGIYANLSAEAAFPGALILDAGTVPTNEVGDATIDITQELEDGILYWLAYVPQGDTPASLADTTSLIFNPFGMPSLAGLNNPGGVDGMPLSWLYDGGSITDALPDPFGDIGSCFTDPDYALVQLQAA